MLLGMTKYGNILGLSSKYMHSTIELCWSCESEV